MRVLIAVEWTTRRRRPHNIEKKKKEGEERGNQEKSEDRKRRDLGSVKKLEAITTMELCLRDESRDERGCKGVLLKV